MKNGKLLVGILAVVLVVGAFLTIRSKGSAGTAVDVYAVLPLTGPVAQLGKTIQDAMHVYMVEHPSSRINIIFVDSASVPDKAVSALNAKTIGKENIIVVSALSSVSSTLIPVVSMKNGFVFPILTVAISNEIKSDRYQRFSMGSKDVVDPIANYAANHYKSIYILSANEDYGLRNGKRFSETFLKGGVSTSIIMGNATFDLQDTNVREIVSKAVSFKPEAIFVTGNGTATYINVIKVINEMGFDGQILADASFSNPFVYNALGTVATRVLFTCANSDLAHPQNKEAIEFQKNCQKHGVSPYGTTSNAYDVLGFIDMLISGDCIISRETIESIGGYTGSDHVQFIGQGDCEYKCKLATIRNGEVVEVVNDVKQ